MKTLLKLLASGVFFGAAFALPPASTTVQAEDCYLYCAGWACDNCPSCSTEPCWSDLYWYCVNSWCS